MKTVLTGHVPVCRGQAFLVAVVALGSFFVAADALAQVEYKQMPLHPKVSKWQALGITDESRQVVNMLRGGALDANAFNNFFETMVFPLFTQWKEVPGPRGTVVNPLHGDYAPAGMRKQFKTIYVVPAKSQAAHEQLNELTLKAMEGIAKDDYHPVCRANAMLLIAELSDDETAGTPWKKAFPTLLSAATSPDTIDSVRVAALRGLVRHAQGGLDPATVPQTTSAMLKLLNEKTPPEKRSREGHDWMRRRAIDVLVAANGATPNPEMVKALLDCVADDKAWMELRCDAAAALAKVPFAPPAGVGLQDVAKSLGKLAVAVARTELDQSRSNAREVSTELIRRQLDRVRQGLQGTDGRGGISAAAQAGDAGQSIRTIVQGIDRIIQDSVALVTTRDEQVQKIVQAADALQNSLDRAAAAPAPAAAPEQADPLNNPAAANPFPM